MNLKPAWRRYALFAVLALTSNVAAALEPIEVQRWQHDLAVYRQTLEARHIRLYHRISKTEFTAALAGLENALPRLNEQQIVVELMRITRLVGDGHTHLAYWDAEHHRYPIAFRSIEGELRVVRTTPAFRQLLGSKLVAVDGMAASKLQEQLAPVAQVVENAQSLRRQTANHANVAEVLYGLGVTRQPRQARFEFVDDVGKPHAALLTALRSDDYYEQLSATIAPDTVPLGRKVAEVSNRLWLSADPAQATAYLYFAQYPSFPEMERFAAKVQSYLRKHRIRKLIIDLRENGGGDFFVGLSFAHQMILVDELDWNGGIYALIGPTTFSAGMSNAAQFRQLFNATLVGEPTGANPVGYQDMDGFVLPHSKRRVNYSKRMYRFDAPSADGLQPDKFVPTTWADLRRGVDAALAWALADRR